MAFEHWVQLFDSDESRADAIARFLRDGFQLGESMVAIARSDRWPGIAARLDALGVPTPSLIEAGQLDVRGAESTLKSLMPGGRLDSACFEALIARPLGERLGHGRPLRVYGEMVDLLARQGDLAGAQALEERWNDLGRQASMTLFCGYSAVNFGDPRTRPALKAICQAHSELRSNPRDALGSFLVSPQALGS